MAHGSDEGDNGSSSSSSSKKRPRDDEEPEKGGAEGLLLEAQALIEGEDPDDTERVVELLQRCIKVAAAVADADEDEEPDAAGGGVGVTAAVVPSLAHTWLAKIREQQQQEEEEEEGEGPVDDSGGPLRAEAAAHYEAALACWPENATAAYALAKLRRPRVRTEAGLDEYERLLRTAVDHAPEEDEETRRSAVEDLALLLLQRSETQKADTLLAELGFTHRLATAVLGYTLPPTLPPTATLGADARPFVRVFDDALGPTALAAMQTAFAPTAPFWREHGYWRADQGYFSYLLPLTGDDDSSSKPTTSPPPPPPRLGIEAVIRQALWPLAVRAFPEVAQAATAEWWAHCRRHSAAHQLHYDSLDEGRGYVQHPIASCVLYLSPCGLGGPTLMTDQTLLGADDDDAGGGGGLAKRGWFSHARVNRVCVFKADYLHGVVPGRGLPPKTSAATETETDEDKDGDGSQRRITFMVGFWRGPVQPKPRGADGRPGASMDVGGALLLGPAEGGKVSLPAWIEQGRELLGGLGGGSLVGEGVVEGRGGVEGPLPCVWERLGGQQQEEGGKGGPPPLYDQCFQGF